MLAYFSASNYRSINEMIELNMRAEPKLRRFKDHVVPLVHPSKPRLLRSSVIYGANASGKSNLIKAIAFAQKLVINGVQRKSGIELDPFLLGSALDEKNNVSSFYFEFSCEDGNDDNHIDRYFAYGMKLSDERVLEESLYEILGKSEFCIFERKFESGIYHITTSYEDGYNKELSVDEIQEFKNLIKYTEDNELFLHEYDKKNLKNKLHKTWGRFCCACIFFFFELIVIYPDSKYGDMVRDINEGSCCNYIKTINKFDTGVNGIELKPVSVDLFHDDIIETLKTRLQKDGKKEIRFTYKNDEYSLQIKGENVEVYKPHSIHKLKDGRTIEFELAKESDGTRRLLDLLPAICATEEDINIGMNHVYVIDEFERSLHPNLSKAFFSMFLDGQYGLIKDQLIVTTHESGLLDNNLLRRDEIWFCQKEKDNSSKLYSLNDYSTRFDSDIRKAYLQGRFGAIPNLLINNVRF